MTDTAPTPPLTVEDAEKDRNFVTALARGLSVLSCFQPGETYLTNHELAERAKLPKATVSRLTYTLRTLGYLALDERTGTYRLDSGVLSLGYAVLSGISITERAQYELDQLREGLNPYVTAGLAERHKLAAVYVASSQSSESVMLAAQIGARMPLFFSASGQAILVRGDDAHRERALTALKLAYPHKYGEGEAALKAAQRDYAELGYCRSYGQWRTDVNGIAVPVLSSDGRRIYALNVGGPSFAVPAEDLERDFAPRLLEAAARLGRPDLG